MVLQEIVGALLGLILGLMVVWFIKILKIRNLRKRAEKFLEKEKEKELTENINKFSPHKQLPVQALPTPIVPIPVPVEPIKKELTEEEKKTLIKAKKDLINIKLSKLAKELEEVNTHLSEGNVQPKIPEVTSGNNGKPTLPPSGNNYKEVEVKEDDETKLPNEEVS